MTPRTDISIRPTDEHVDELLGRPWRVYYPAKLQDGKVTYYLVSTWRTASEAIAAAGDTGKVRRAEHLVPQRYE